MSFQLSLGEISKAREIARRGLRLINYREGEERLNLWIALLNLENAYGDEESFDSVFKEASQVNDTKMIYRLSASLLEKDGKIEVRLTVLLPHLARIYGNLSESARAVQKSIQEVQHKL